MRSSKRTLLFNIILTCAVAFAVIYFSTKAYDLYFDLQKEPGNDAYQLNDAINDDHKAKSRVHPYGFTDRLRTVAKPKGVFRIAVLGDSYIWGDGLPTEQIWSHRLEQKILNEFDSVEVMSWGQCGWSTLDEFNFYKAHGKDYDIDLLIIGWVDNDPDMGTFKQVPRLKPEKEYPRTWKMYPALAQRWVNSREQSVYDPWLDSIYSASNLKAYQLLLDTMGAVFREKHLKTLVALTPCCLDESARTHFAIVKPQLQLAGLTYFDLLPGTTKKLGHYCEAQLQANPVNGHPGPLMTEEFATEVLDFLKSNGYLSGIKKR